MKRTADLYKGVSSLRKDPAADLMASLDVTPQAAPRPMLPMAAPALPQPVGRTPDLPPAPQSYAAAPPQPAQGMAAGQPVNGMAAEPPMQGMAATPPAQRSIVSAYLSRLGGAVKDIVTAPQRAWNGDLQVFGPDGHPTDEAIMAAHGMAGAAITGGLPMAAGAAARPALAAAAPAAREAVAQAAAHAADPIEAIRAGLADHFGNPSFGKPAPAGQSVQADAAIEALRAGLDKHFAAGPAPRAGGYGSGGSGQSVSSAFEDAGAQLRAMLAEPVPARAPNPGTGVPANYRPAPAAKPPRQVPVDQGMEAIRQAVLGGIAL